MALSGRIDLHSHLLPGIDDGCRRPEDALACVRTLIAHGFVATACTPHMAVSSFPDNTPGSIATRVAALQEELRRAGLEYTLHAGGELRLAANTIAWLRRHGVPTLGASRNVLIDYWGMHWPSYADPVIDDLFEAGYQPILAHPERMEFEDREWDSVLDRLQERGVRLQGNLKCLAGHEGARIEKRALRLLREDRYLTLATDMHGSHDLADRLAGLSLVEQEVGAGKLAEMLAQQPHALLTAH